ncbi:hypothetical protein ACSLPG_37030, partial [Escherichia coli]|uniref:hypothetical protein n=1 Tax=Escherichia coli TaxID=562 RepID=UPI003EE11BED
YPALLIQSTMQTYLDLYSSSIPLMHRVRPENGSSLYYSGVQSRAKRWPKGGDKFKPLPEGFQLAKNRKKLPPK